MKAETVAAAVYKTNPEAAIHIAPTIEDAVDISGARAASQNRKIYVAGGLFLAIEYAVVAKGGRAQELNFF
jgi:dihydrofolate synthase/folylpolyglutamate synthase